MIQITEEDLAALLADRCAARDIQHLTDSRDCLIREVNALQASLKTQSDDLAYALTQAQNSIPFDEHRDKVEKQANRIRELKAQVQNANNEIVSLRDLVRGQLRHIAELEARVSNDIKEIGSLRAQVEAQAAIIRAAEADLLRLRGQA